MVDDGFEVRAYVWLLLWYGFFVFDTVSGWICGACDAGGGERVQASPLGQA